MAMRFAPALTEELDKYTPCIFDNDRKKEQSDNRMRMYFLVGKILEVSNKHFSLQQHEKIIAALRFSAVNHSGARRKDGFTPYFMHLLEVVNILFEMKVWDFKITVAAILHDVVEDVKVSLKKIGMMFGSAIRHIVDLMSKPDKQMHTTRKIDYWLRMKREVDLNCKWRVIVLKFADRIHNMMTLWVLPIEKQKEKLAETKKEFPGLYEVLKQTILKLYKRGTIKKTEYKTLPFRLNNRLWYEMERYT